MPLELFYSEGSPFCRSVRLTARALGLKIHLKKRDIHQHNPDLKAVNPQHTIPTLVDGDFVLWESRAIMTYLVTQYGANDHLYPKDPKKRAHVDRLLYFDCGTLNYRLWNMVVPVMHKDLAKASEESLQKFKAAMGSHETFLQGNRWVAGGNHFTLADICLVVSLSAGKEANLNLTNYPNIKAWMARCEAEMPDYKEINLPGAKELGAKVPASAGLADI